MIVPGSLWVACTVAAAAGQTLRNAMQHSLIGTVGTAGATHVRFLYGLPFACVFLAVVASTGAIRDPQIGPAFWAWLTLGALTQVLATAMMLVLMQQRSFVVRTAYIKTEPVQIALYGFVFLGDRLGLQAIAGVRVATAGVVLMSWRRAPADAVPVAGARASMWRAALLGIATGSMFSLSVVGYRGAVLALGDDPFYGRATLALVLALALQTVLLSLYLRVREPGRLTGLVRAWKPSLLAGLLGATASQFWFLAFSLQTAAAVRTVGLVEVVFAALISRRLFAQQGSAREWGGIAMVVCGVALLLTGTF